MRLGGRYQSLIDMGQKLVPLAIRASARVEPSSNASPEANALKNATQEPWEIHEIKFGVRRVPAGEGPAELYSAEQQATGALLDVSLSWNGRPITDGFVPVWSCAPQVAIEEYAGTFDIIPTLNSPRGFDSYYCWKLDHPLHVQPGGSLEVEFRNNGLANYAVQASVIFSGRVLPGGARATRVKVPFVSAWRSGFYEYLSGEGQEVSPQTVLMNRFSSSLTVERFINRIAVKTQAIELGELYEYLGGIGRIAFQNLFEIRMAKTTGDIVVRDWTSVSNVFGWRGLRWEQRHKLVPNEGHQLAFRKVPAPAGCSYLQSELASVIDSRAQAQVSFVGWREEVVS